MEDLEGKLEDSQQIISESPSAATSLEKRGPLEESNEAVLYLASDLLQVTLRNTV